MSSSQGSASPKAEGFAAPRIAILAFGLLMAFNIGLSILRIEQGGWVIWPVIGLAFFTAMMVGIRKRYPLVFPCLRTSAFVGVLMGGLELLSHTPLFRLHGVVEVLLSLVSILALSSPASRRFFGSA